jgi:hypothetical protein
VDIGIGQGDSCVDLAIKDDLNADSYIAGILVDGENYAKAATARDRDQQINGIKWIRLADYQYGQLTGG